MTSPAQQLSFFDHGSVGAGTSTPDLTKGDYHRVTCTAATRTIADPILGVRVTPTGDVAVPVNAGSLGRKLYIEVKNTSGGGLTITWGSAFKGPAVAIVSATRRIFEFLFDGTNWVVVNPAADVAN